VFDGLEEPVIAESVNKELWDCLQQARCSNPLHQDADVLHKFFEICREPQ
jgi:hypothetical protein